MNAVELFDGLASRWSRFPRRYAEDASDRHALYDRHPHLEVPLIRPTARQHGRLP